ncbi:hypothetical protein T492DRAFT_841433 [Pavlovales sp. CCMP2436]|nr:hypothetical protein T492DRAFT_841433 [Pavlovales sp. CCMP2436]
MWGQSDAQASLSLLLIGVDDAAFVDLLSWRLALHVLTTGAAKGVAVSLVAAQRTLSSQQAGWISPLVTGARLQVLEVPPLPRADAIDLFKARLGISHALPSAVESAMVLRAQGSPYVVCEMARYLIDLGHVREAGSDGSSDTVTGDGSVAHTGTMRRRSASSGLVGGERTVGMRFLSGGVNVAELRALPTVEHRVLRAQIDRLPAAEHRLLKTCAIIGEAFSLADVSQVFKSTLK